jgi:hypothetical protein
LELKRITVAKAFGTFYPKVVELIGKKAAGGENTVFSQGFIGGFDLSLVNVFTRVEGIRLFLDPEQNKYRLYVDLLHDSSLCAQGLVSDFGDPAHLLYCEIHLQLTENGLTGYVQFEESRYDITIQEPSKCGRLKLTFMQIEKTHPLERSMKALVRQLERCVPDDVVSTLTTPEDFSNMFGVFAAEVFENLVRPEFNTFSVFLGEEEVYFVGITKGNVLRQYSFNSKLKGFLGHFSFTKEGVAGNICTKSGIPIVEFYGTIDEWGTISYVNCRMADKWGLMSGAEVKWKVSLF